MSTGLQCMYRLAPIVDAADRRVAHFERKWESWKENPIKYSVLDIYFFRFFIPYFSISIVRFA